jgi:peptide chain release factor 3
MSTELIQATLEQTRRRRTFAIISHPDAGKTTLTEKLLLFAGAIQIAGSVKARKATRHATSDWMEIEKQRGISVASSVMQMVYRDHVVNLLDTPGHRDFSEDTYRVLTAVDCALMVIDAANGVEAQTKRLIEVCRQRDTPIITFVNKMDREVRDPLDILDEVERELGMPCVPMTWPVGKGKSFGGIMNLRTQAMTVFESGSDRLPQDFEAVPLADVDALQARFGSEYTEAVDTMELACGASPQWNHAAFLGAKQTPVFFGSGVNNFGVMEALDALVDLAPAPQARRPGNAQDSVAPENPAFSGVVFKVQANMDPSHRDRIAFVRVCSGRYGAGMKLKVQRSKKELRPTSVVTFLSQRREAVEEAYAGDIIGFTTHGGAVHRLAFFRARDVSRGRAQESAAHQAVATRPRAIGRRRRDSGLQAGSRRKHAAWRHRSTAVRSRATPFEDRIRLRRLARGHQLHKREVDHQRRHHRAAAVHQHLPPAACA